MPALSCDLAIKRYVPLVGIFTTTDQLVVPVAGTYGPLPTCTATSFLPLPPTLSSKVPDIIRLTAGNVTLLFGFVMVTAGAVVS